MNNRIAAVLTVIEVIVLVVWLALATGVSPVAGLGKVSAASAAMFLFVGILVEELLRYRLLTGAFPKNRAQKLVALGVAIETVGWIVALLAVSGAGDPFTRPSMLVEMMQSFLGAAIVILFGFLAVEHAVIDSATRGTGLRELRLGQVLGFSAVEAVGGAIWLFNPVIGTIIVLIVTSFFEHRDGIALSKR